MPILWYRAIHKYHLETHVNLVVPHKEAMIQYRDLDDVAAGLPAANSEVGQAWANAELTAQERSNLSLISDFWKCWK
ncbi:MAG: hypothetical protein EOP84_26955, partial [Verrucomicrobiaceae bacterium]